MPLAKIDTMIVMENSAEDAADQAVMKHERMKTAAREIVIART